jgi:hypothetical protein
MALGIARSHGETDRGRWFYSSLGYHGDRLLSVIAMLALVQPILTGIEIVNHSPGALMAELQEFGDLRDSG